MKLEVGRVYVLVDEGTPKFKSDAKLNRLVRLVRVHANQPYDIEKCDVEGFYIDGEVSVILPKFVDASVLKPASEKQRVMFNRKYSEMVREFEDKEKEMIL